MQITLNGDAVRFADAPTIDELLLRTGNAGRRVAVEVNRAIVPRSEHGTRCVADGDVVEIVTALGGG
jgi:sulfur carrier protein